MLNPIRAMLLGVLGVCCVGAMAVWEPPAVAMPEQPAPLLGVIYVQPVEEIETHVVRRGETLSAVMARFQITGGELANMLLALREQANPRRLRDGSEITVRRWSGDGAPRAVEVRFNADSTVRLDRVETGWEGRVVVTPTTFDTVFVAGQIESGRTLYEALVGDDELDLPPGERAQLVWALADIYAYKLDFSHDIQPGDRYRLAYEREARPDGTARSRRILIAEIENQGHSFSAVHFDGGDQGSGYYDTEGKSLKLAFRRYPVDLPRITSSFSWKRYHPILGVHRAHLGTDFGAPQGTPVKATAAGVVTFAGRQGGYGNLVKVRHWGGYTTSYAHLSRFGKGVRSGRKVEQGEVIGYVGATGLATAPHLHYEFRQNGKPLDARTAKLPGAPPITGKDRPLFERTVQERAALLEQAQQPDVRFARRREEPQRVMPGAGNGT